MFKLNRIILILFDIYIFLNLIDSTNININENKNTDINSILFNAIKSSTELDRSIISNFVNKKTRLNQNRKTHFIQNLPVNYKTNLLKLKRKRCRYSDHDIANLTKKNSNQNYDQNYSIKQKSFNYYIKNDLNFIKQPKIRDPSHKHLSSANSIEPQYEKEIIYVNIGDTINLTCSINTKEIDWHFKDKNLTTTILSYGLQLQVPQPNLYDFNMNDFLPSIKYSDDYETSQNIGVTSPLVKYKVSSDKEAFHVLSLYVQGPQDEGSYQCIDSKSESPIKKSIQVYLKNHARALTSGYAGQNLNSLYSVYFFLQFFFIIFVI